MLVECFLLCFRFAFHCLVVHKFFDLTIAFG